MIVALLAAAVTAAPPVLIENGERPAYEAMLNKEALDADATFGGQPCPQTERLKVVGCGRSTIVNINVGRFGGSPPWKMVAGVPGDSRASFLLQQSTWPQAVAEAQADIP
jgi:hypothetical protein